VAAERDIKFVIPDSTPARATDIPSLDRLLNDPTFAPLIAPHCAANWSNCDGAPSLRRCVPTI
jgi:hypothetical protein